MGAKVVAGVIGFVVLVLIIQNYVLGGGGGGGLDSPGQRVGVAPTATMPAQLPEPVSLGEVQIPGGGGGMTTTGGGTYVVQSGDTLGTIAASFDVPGEEQAAWISEVLDLNGIQDARLLQAGQELIIPVRTVTTAPSNNGQQQQQQQQQGGITMATPTPTAGGGGGGAGGGGTYEVVSGDTPFGIAEKHCVEGPTAWVNDFLALNRIDANSLQVGQVLDLPTGTPARC